jgi:hypothetical protein
MLIPTPAPRTIVALGLLLGLFMAATQADAQDRPVTTLPERADSLKVTASGGIKMDYVTRSREITGFINSLSNPTHDPALLVTPNPITSEPENTFHGEVFIRIGTELSSKITGVVEFGTRPFFTGPAGAGGFADGGITRYGGSSANPIELREANIRLADFPGEGVVIEAGISTWVFNPRGKGGALAFDPRHSGVGHANLEASQINGAETIDGRLAAAGDPQEVQPLGGTVTYGFESYRAEVVILPAVQEDGRPNADEALYAIDFWWDLPQVGNGSRVGVIVALMSVDTAQPSGLGNEHARVWTLGGGGTFKLFDGALELWGEAYAQLGKASETVLGDDIDAAGRAFRVGLEWNHTVGNPMPIWAGVNYTHISGDDDTDPNDDEANRFAAYESISDLMILEDPYYGFDWDGNYEAVKFYAGTALSAMGGKDDLELTLTVGIAKAAEEVGAGALAEDKLGNEVDVRVKWHLGKQATITLAAAHLFGSDILEAAMDAGGGPGSNPQANDSAYLYVLGVSVGF